MSLKMNLSLSLPSSVDDPVQTGDTSIRRNCRQIGALFKSLASGNLSIGNGRLGSNHAYGTVVLASTSGDLVVTIAGTSVTRTHASSDDADGAALAVSINANATLNKLVKARYATATDTLTVEALVAGSGGNYSFAVSGTGLTVSGPALTLGADDVVLDFRSAADKAWAFVTATHTITGTVGAVIGGTTVTITAPLGVGDTVAGRAAANQGLREIANAINANTTVNKWVRARTVPNAYVQLTSTTADVVTVTVNGTACSATGLDTDEDVTGPLLVTAINALTGTHGCVARYVASSDILYVRSVVSDKRVSLAVSGAGAGTSAVGGVATKTISIDAVTADVITVTIGGVACTITGTNTDEDTQGALLVTAINAKTGAHGCVASYATGGGGGAAGTLTVTSKWPGAAGNQVSLAITGAGIGSSAVTGAAVALDGGYDRCEIECLVPGVIGNAIALTASGTGITAVGALLSGGTESRVAYTL
jgi:hypothetical protein